MQDDCINCVNEFYYYNNSMCAIGSAIPNYNSTSFACSTGFETKLELFNGQTIGCACSSASGYFLNGSTCTACSAAPSPSTSTGCQSCLVSQGYFLNHLECVY